MRGMPPHFGLDGGRLDPGKLRRHSSNFPNGTVTGTQELAHLGCEFMGIDKSFRA